MDHMLNRRARLTYPFWVSGDPVTGSIYDERSHLLYCHGLVLPVGCKVDSLVWLHSHRLLRHTVCTILGCTPDRVRDGHFIFHGDGDKGFA